MSQFTGARSHSLVVLAGMALLPFVVTMGACGQKKPAESPAAESESAAPAGSESAAAEESDAAPAASSSAAPAESAKEEAPAPAASPGSTKATAKHEIAWATCHSSFTPKGKSVSADVTALAKGCAKATKMKVIGKTLTGKLADGANQSFPLKAKANKCYRVYAQGAETFKDLDVAIKDSAGATAGEDSTDASNAVVLDDGAVCFKEADSATVVVSAGSGNGAFAAQIWGD
jgi:predicted small lipoprotein YifL